MTNYGINPSNKQEKVNYLVRSCYELFKAQHEKGNCFITHSGSLSFLCQKAFKAYYLMSNDLRNIDYQAYQSLRRTLAIAFYKKEED